MMKRKLRQQSGETLIEAMVSLLVALLSMGLLCTSVLAATNINQATREADTRFDKELERAEKRISEDGYEVQEDCTLLIEFDTLEPKMVDVDVYGGEESSLISYEEPEVSEQ